VRFIQVKGNNKSSGFFAHLQTGELNGMIPTFARINDINIVTRLAYGKKRQKEYQLDQKGIVKAHCT